jgi:hypothetical protein
MWTPCCPQSLPPRARTLQSGAAMDAVMAKLRAATTFPCFRPPSAQTNHRTSSLTSRRTSCALRLRPLIVGAQPPSTAVAPCHRCTWPDRVQPPRSELRPSPMAHGPPSAPRRSAAPAALPSPSLLRPNSPPSLPLPKLQLSPVPFWRCSAAALLLPTAGQGQGHARSSPASASLPPPAEPDETVILSNGFDPSP